MKENLFKVKFFKMYQGRKSLFSKVFDTVAFFHFFLAIVLIAVGETTEIFSKFIFEKNRGIEFVFRYLDLPVFYVIKDIVFKSGTQDLVFKGLVCLFVIVASSVIYGLLAFILVKFIISLFE